jgi:anion transporter
LKGTRSKKWTKLAGLMVSSVTVGLVLNLPLPGNPGIEIRKTLAITLFTVCWWIFAVAPTVFTTLLMLLAFILSGTAGTELVFRPLTLPLIWLIIGAFLIARATTKSGLAQRVAYIFLERFASSYRRIIVSTYMLGFLLGFLVPHPFPRALLIMSILRVIIRQSGANRQDATSMGFSVFASMTATSTILLTGDSTLNGMAAGFSGATIGWLDWARYMAIPGMIASAMMLALHFLVFKQSGQVKVDRNTVRAERQAMGSMNRTELTTLCWVCTALIFWMTDALHGINPAWIAIAASIGLSLPIIGEVLDADDVSAGVNWPIIIFVVGALAIGAVGQTSGMSDWLASILLPTIPPENPYSFALLVGLVTMAVHMLLGSAMASMSIVLPPLVRYAMTAGMNPLIPSLLVYMAVAIHYILPFHHVTILIGQGETGGYGAQEVIRYGLPLTIVALFVMIVVQTGWWQILGLL